MTKRKRTGGGGASAIGGILAGFDQQVFRTTPPPHELVLKARPVRGLSGEGGELQIGFPDDEPADLSDEAATPPEPPEPAEDPPG